MTEMRGSLETRIQKEEERDSKMRGPHEAHVWSPRLENFSKCWTSNTRLSHVRPAFRRL